MVVSAYFLNGCIQISTYNKIAVGAFLANFIETFALYAFPSISFYQLNRDFYNMFTLVRKKSGIDLTTLKTDQYG